VLKPRIPSKQQRNCFREMREIFLASHCTHSAAVKLVSAPTVFWANISLFHLINAVVILFPPSFSGEGCRGRCRDKRQMLPQTLIDRPRARDFFMPLLSLASRPDQHSMGARETVNIAQQQPQNILNALCLIIHRFAAAQETKRSFIIHFLFSVLFFLLPGPVCKHC